MRPALTRAGADQQTADDWSQTFADLLSAGTFGTELGAGFRREIRHSVPGVVEFELRLLNSAGRGGETGPLLLTGLDRERLKRIRTYTDWLLTESQRPPHE